MACGHGGRVAWSASEVVWLSSSRTYPVLRTRALPRGKQARVQRRPRGPHFAQSESANSVGTSSGVACRSLSEGAESGWVEAVGSLAAAGRPLAALSKAVVPRGQDQISSFDLLDALLYR
jgi:hypothetical protein